MILNQQRRVRVRPAVLNEFLARVRSTVGVSDQSVSICLVTDAAMSRMNKRYRGKRGPTDVLSFPANGRVASARKSAPPRPFFLGDIAISPETARRNARRFGRTLDDELRILILHGILHLLGYDHEADHGEMEQIEIRLRRELKVAGA